MLIYNPETGVFTWLVDRGARKVKGQKAGGLTSNGYIGIRVNGTHYIASRLAWLYMEGYWPEQDIDHKNRNRADNRWENLRHVSRVCNSRNCGVRKHNSSGVTGVNFDTYWKRWVAKITVNKKRIHIGVFDSKLNAAKARFNAEVKYGFLECNLKSSAYQYIKIYG